MGSCCPHQLRAAHPNLSKKERNSFLLLDLGVNPADVTDVFMVPSTQLLRIGFHAGLCLTALAKLQSGVPWTAADPGVYVIPCRLLVPGPNFWLHPHLAMDHVVAHMVQFSRVVQSAGGVDCPLGNVFDGVIPFIIQLHNNITFLHFISIEE